MTTSARPCDSPAVRKRTIRGQLYTKFLRAPVARGRHHTAFHRMFSCFSDEVIFLHYRLRPTAFAAATTVNKPDTTSSG
jgi:hypothetical protein